MTFGCRDGVADIISNQTQCTMLEFQPNQGFPSNLGLDELAFWNRTLSDNEITMLYYNGTNGTLCKGDPCTWNALTVITSVFNDCNDVKGKEKFSCKFAEKEHVGFRRHSGC